ncbi:hypothetical protein RIF29_26812 [Crotalaria pallida]|uniref:Uncharacterized protein n=1 Tax=Crotalaria pallida TaxID=3830 RepID=A0AAN9EVD7_CROPI
MARKIHCLLRKPVSELQSSKANMFLFFVFLVSWFSYLYQKIQIMLYCYGLSNLNHLLFMNTPRIESRHGNGLDLEQVLRISTPHPSRAGQIRVRV